LLVSTIKVKESKKASFVARMAAKDAFLLQFMLSI
jgi:hypothetical protein